MLLHGHKNTTNIQRKHLPAATGNTDRRSEDYSKDNNCDELYESETLGAKKAPFV